MHTAKTITHILCPVFIGVIIGGIIANNTAAWVCGMIFLFADIVVGIILQYQLEQQVHNSSRNNNGLQEKQVSSRQYTPISTMGFLKNGHYSIGDFIKEELLTGRLEDIVVIVGNFPKSKYDKDTNSIYIGELDNKTKDKFVEAICRCFQQAYCVEMGILYGQTAFGINDDEVTDEDLFDDLDEGSKDFIKNLKEAERQKYSTSNFNGSTTSNQTVKLCDKLTTIFSNLKARGGAEIVKSVNETEAGRFLIEVCQQMPYAPTRNMFNGIYTITVECLDNLPAIVYSFKAMQGSLAQLVYIFLIRTHSDNIRLFTVETSFPFALCEYRDGKHLNYGQLDLSETPTRIIKILNN